MDPVHKKTLKAIILEIRHLLEGYYDNRNMWQPGDLERRLAAIGIRRDRKSLPIDEMPHLSDADKRARKVVDAYLSLRVQAGIELSAAVAEFVRETAYSWANRLLALRCMEARELIDEVILQKPVYGGRSLEHHRLAQRQPERCSGEDDGLFAVFEKVFEARAKTLPLLFDPKSPALALKPTAAGLMRCVRLLSGTEQLNGQTQASDDVFKAPDALGWAYQYWNTEEKERVFEKVRTQKGAKIEGADIIPATQLYTEPYMVKFLVQNSLGAIWASMHPDTRLINQWEYFVRDADRAPVKKKPVKEITFLDPAFGSGHFFIEAFDVFYTMYEEEGQLTDPDDICRSILENNLFGIDIDERAMQIAEAALWMKAAEKAFEFEGAATNLVATNIRLPKGKDHLEEFLKNHPEDKPIRPALEVIFEGLAHADELGSLLQIEEPVERELKHLKEMHDTAKSLGMSQGDLFRPTAVQDHLPFGIEDYEEWKKKTVAALKQHFDAEAESADLGQAFFGQSAGKGMELFDLLSRRYDVVAANPPYMGLRQMGGVLDRYIRIQYPDHNDDLYAAFIGRSESLSNQEGLVGLVIQQGFFFTSSYISARDDFWSKWSLLYLMHIGTGGFQEISGAVVNTALMVIEHKPPNPTSNSHFIDIRSSQEKAIAAKIECSKGPTYTRRYASIIGFPRMRLCYWFPDDVAGLFSDLKAAESVMDIRQGLATGDNVRFVRQWWECTDNCRWVTIIMSAGTERWLSENNRVVEWEYDGSRLRSYVAERHGSVSKRIYSEGYYFREGITFGRFTAGSLAVRYVPEGCLFDNAAPCAFPYNTGTALAFLNSNLCAFIANGLNTTSSFQVGDMKDIPMIEEADPILEQAALSCIDAQRSFFKLRPTYRNCSILDSSIGIRQVSLSQMTKVQRESLEKAQSDLAAAEARLNDRIFEKLNISAHSRKTIESHVQGPRKSGSVSPVVLLADTFTVAILNAGGHCWPKQVKANEPIPHWADKDGIIPLTEVTNEQTLLNRIRERIAVEFEGGDVASIEREFADIMGKPLDQWLETEFFKNHVSQFKKRPIAWQIQSGKYARNNKPAFACMVYYHKLDEDLLPKIRTQYVSPLRQRFETELRGIEALPLDARSDRQEKRRVELETQIEEMKAIDGRLKELTESAFGPQRLILQLRQNAIEDSMLCLRTRWLKKLSSVIRQGPLEEWTTLAEKAQLHEKLPEWIREPVYNLHHFCSSVGAGIPKEKEFKRDPDSRELAGIICAKAGAMIAGSLGLVCTSWRKNLDDAVFSPLRGRIRELQEEVKTLKEREAIEGKENPQLLFDFEMRIEALKGEIRTLKTELAGKLEKAKKLQRKIESWFSEEALTWESWLAGLPMYDAISGIDDRHNPPESVQDFIRQESAYIPDINDGVRVNIAPLQKAGVLAADVLAKKDLDKAIADRAEWRADERRWCREGKLPQPGWWPDLVQEKI